jgi:hypothetical protein
MRSHPIFKNVTNNIQIINLSETFLCSRLTISKLFYTLRDLACSKTPIKLKRNEFQNSFIVLLLIFFLFRFIHCLEKMSEPTSKPIHFAYPTSFSYIYLPTYIHKSGKKPTYLARYVHIEVAAYSRLAKATFPINFLR